MDQSEYIGSTYASIHSRKKIKERQKPSKESPHANMRLCAWCFGYKIIDTLTKAVPGTCSHLAVAPINHFKDLEQVRRSG